MPPKLTPKPGIVKVNRFIPKPRTTAVVSSPKPKIVVKPRSQPVAQKRIAVAHQSRSRNNAVLATPSPGIVRPNKLRQQKRQRGLKVTYTRHNISNDSKARIKEIRNIGRGKVLIMIGNGPSVIESDLENLTNHSHIDIMSINKPDQRVWPSKYWLFCDRTQLKRNEKIWESYNGTIINSTSIRKSKRTSFQVRNRGGNGFSTDLLEGFYLGRSSVYSAMQVAYWMNYEHFYIFGCDMSAVTINGEKMLHFYGENPDVKHNSRVKRFDEEAKSYNLAANALSAEDRARYTFCSAYNPYNFINRFNKLDHRKAVPEILQHADKLAAK